MGDSRLRAAAHADRDQHLLHQQKVEVPTLCFSEFTLRSFFRPTEGEFHGGLTFEDGQQDLQTLGFGHDLGDLPPYGGEYTVTVTTSPTSSVDFQVRELGKGAFEHPGAA